MTTRERILEEALNLFSEKGYEGVSVRDIACRVGIKDSSLYNHFRSKRQIFDTIVEECCQRAEQYFQERSLPFNLDDDISMYYNTPFERLEKMIIATFGYFFEDSHNVRFRKLLLLSQYEDEKARKIYRQLYCEYPLEFQSRLFEKLIQSGEFSRMDTKVMALDFYGAVFLLIHTCDSLSEARPRLVLHLKHFVEKHQKEK